MPQRIANVVCRACYMVLAGISWSFPLKLDDPHPLVQIPGRITVQLIPERGEGADRVIVGDVRLGYDCRRSIGMTNRVELADRRPVHAVIVASLRYALGECVGLADVL